MNDILTIIGLTFLPLLELRASIPYGLFNTDLSWVTVFIVAVLANIALGPLLYLFLDRFVHIFLHVKIINKYYQKIIIQAQKKVSKYIEKYGIIGLAIFIGVPLPGSGVYSAALGAYFLGFKFKDFFWATIIGVLIAGVIVLAVCTLGNGAWDIFVKKV
ncbi:MAG: small multi-drug export protein [Nanoarchaeota archaeon]